MADNSSDDGKWQKKWPVEAGFWWLFGKLCKGDKDRWHFVEVWKTSNDFTYVVGNLFIYREEGVGGLWRKVELPDLPQAMN